MNSADAARASSLAAIGGSISTAPRTRPGRRRNSSSVTTAPKLEPTTIVGPSTRPAASSACSSTLPPRRSYAISENLSASALASWIDHVVWSAAEP
jgi:hypothetical protein